jgi:hypothetical protein
MTFGILTVLAAISFVFYGVTFLNHDFTQAETTSLTLLVTVVPFGYMRLFRMQSRLHYCPDCGSDKLLRVLPKRDGRLELSGWAPTAGANHQVIRVKLRLRPSGGEVLLGAEIVRAVRETFIDLPIQVMEELQLNHGSTVHLVSHEDRTVRSSASEMELEVIQAVESSPEALRVYLKGWEAAVDEWGQAVTQTFKGLTDGVSVQFDVPRQSSLPS